VWSRRTTTDAGQQVEVVLPTRADGADPNLVRSSLSLSAYAGVDPASDPAADVVSGSDDVSSTVHRTPELAVDSPSWVLTYWGTRSTGTGSPWVAPAEVRNRSETAGDGGGRTAALLGDSGAPVPAGAYLSRVARTPSAPVRATMVVLSLGGSAP